MTFLYPAMLLGLLGFAVPIALHLIARHRFPVQDFPSIRLLRFERRHNVFAWKLVDPWQLLLRLAVLLLLVAAMARLFSGCATRPAPRNLVVILDTSASMRMEGRAPDGSQASLVEIGRNLADRLLADVAETSRCALLVAGDDTRLLSPLLPSSDAARAALADVRPGDGTGPGLPRAIADACDLVRGRREARSQVVVLTDLRRTAFDARHQADLRRIRDARDELGDALDLVFIDLAGGQTENLAILDARMRGGEVRVGDDAHVIVRLLNSGAEPRQATLKLGLGGRTAAQSRPVDLPPGGTAVVDLSLPANRATRAFADVHLPAPDSMPLDDRRLAPLLMADAARVLIVRAGLRSETPSASDAVAQLGGGPVAASPAGGDDAPAIDGATILRFVLNPGRELGLAYSTGIETTLVTPEALTAQPLSKYDIVILYDVSDLPGPALRDLDTFARSGKSVVLFASAECSPVRFNRSLAAGVEDRPPLSPALIGNDREPASPLGIASDAALHPVLAPFRDPARGDLSVIRFARVRELQALPDGVEVLMAADDGTPLAVHRRHEAGHVVLCTFGVELDRGNVARTRAFPVLVWRLVDWLSGRLDAPRPDLLAAAAPTVLNVGEIPFLFEHELDILPATLVRENAAAPSAEAAAGPAADPITIAIATNRTILVPPLTAGAYWMQKPRREQGAVAGYQRPLAVNPDPRESFMERFGAPDLTGLLGAPCRIMPAGDAAGLALRGSEFWTLLVTLLALAYLVEAIAGFLANARRERQRSAEGGAA